MRKIISILFCIILAVAIFGCKQKSSTGALTNLSYNISFLDSVNAAQRIIRDSSEHFFKYINKLDMALQLKRNYPDSIDRVAILQDYKTELQQSVSDFSEDEKTLLSNCFQQVYRGAFHSLGSIIDFPVHLIKISGKHYGNNAYYTRENCIMIPEKELLNPDIDLLANVIEHELFHIYSRYHSDKRNQLYHLIGFTSIGSFENLQLEPAIKNKILLNPDGINYAYAIELEDTSKTYAYNAIPIVSSSKKQFDPLASEFFSYLDFDLYKIDNSNLDSIKVVSTESGEPTIDYTVHPEYWDKIGDNTDYIIHPDEILADNFVLLLDGPTSWEGLSPRGQEILKQMEKIIFD